MALKEVGLDAEVRELEFVSGWDCSLSIRDPAYRNLTVEVLTLFDFDQMTTNFGNEDLIRFRSFGQ